MQQLIFFIQKYKYFLYFLLLQLFAFGLIVNNNAFHKSKFITSTNFITGNIHEKSSNVSDYFNLKSRNESLAFENQELKNQIDVLKSELEKSKINSGIDTSTSNHSFFFTSGKIIANTYNRRHNYLTINIGKHQDIKKEMGVINNKGIVGITEHTSNNYTRVQSILNKNFNINAKFKHNNHFGSLTWNGNNYNIVQLTDVPRQANFTIGDTIITGGKSAIFPEGILIGKVISKPEKKSAINSIDIELFNDMSNLKHIYVIKNFNKEEIKSLEKTVYE